MLTVDRLLERESAKKKASKGEPNFVKLTTDGTWRLILTTGDVKTQNALGGAKLNYVPIKAMQQINPDKTISTGALLALIPLSKLVLLKLQLF
jgi:hypothetical protein